ncbi:MAG: protein-L-isoaspartate(D-aspartate) O-methyltransferase [Sphingobium sp.]|nr:protein-L-isoaspartate(D-aspartate) O-methyltransferase [Sphingobium sp.]
MDLMEQQREAMVDLQIVARGIKQPDVVRAMKTVPREIFVPEHMQEFAYEDTPLPIAQGQTISQPYIVGLMIQAAEIQPGDRVLEIGLGSGYAAAVMSRIARRVHAIDRHKELTDLARERMERLGYDNVVIRTADGTNGWPENAPFDVILVAAGGPHVPAPLCEQLAVGGRLVIPVGDPDQQRLVRVWRLGETNYKQDDLGAVHFVPLIGAHGWKPDKGTDALVKGSLPQRIAAAAEPLPEFDDPAFGALFDRFGEARVVLLGEASHGTSEFYRARAAITRRLVEQHGFTLVAVEADWPDAAVIDRHIRYKPPVADAEPAFQRFPTWMWRNEEMSAFIAWMRVHNADRPMEERVSFHGLDLYNLNGSIREVLRYLDAVDPEAAAVARERYGCLTPWRSDPQKYGHMALTEGFARCEQGVVAQLQDLFSRSRDYAVRDGDDFLDAAQNARLVANAEAYYRVMYYGAAESWNLRDTHMFDTLELLLKHRGPQAKAVVWAHNSHIGDARATEMGAVRGELNIGQLCREHYGEEVRLIGLGANSGTVAAATDWDGEMEIKKVNPSLPDSYERQCHDSGVTRFLLDLRKDRNREVHNALAKPLLERFIGVIYRPETERWSHYSSAVMPRQFDAWLWLDRTRALAALPTRASHETPDTFPFGL